MGFSKKKCSKCKIEFECEGSESCWCMKVNNIPKEFLDDSDCMCKDCLLLTYNKKI